VRAVPGSSICTVIALKVVSTRLRHSAMTFSSMAGMGRVAADPGGQVVARPGPPVRAADPGRVLHRQRAGIDLLAVILGQPGREDSPELLERAPRPAAAAVGLALVRQDREQVAPVAGDLGQECGLAAPPQQVPDLRDRQQLGISAGRGGSRAARDPDRPGQDQVVDQHVDVHEQLFSRQYGGTASADKRLRQSFVFRRGRPHLKPTRLDQPT
jgi:hypothetical protein